MLGESGILGTLAWAFWNGIIFILAWLVWRNDSGPSLGAGLLAAWLVFHLNGMTQVNAWESKVMHNMAWFVTWTLFFYRTRVQRVKPDDFQRFGPTDAPSAG